MFNHEKTTLEKTIDELHVVLAEMDPTDEAYDRVTTQLQKLYRMRENDRSYRRVSPDAMAVCATNLAGIGMIIGYERVNVITSKALAFVMKLK